MNVLEFQNVNKKYGSKMALNHLTFSIEENKITGLIGRNGAGKTTMLKIASGFIREQSGDVLVFGEHPFNNLKVSANLILIDQDMQLPSSLTLAEILETAADFYPKWDQELAKRLFDYFSFHPNQNHDGLSKGMKSTFHAILGIASRCPLTIYDEPTIGMDAAVRKDFYRALLKDYLEVPRTIIISSHHLQEVEEILETILLIKDGEAALHMPVEEMREYAVGVSGKQEFMGNWLTDQEVLYQKKAVLGSTYAVVRNSFSEEQKQNARQHGVEFSAVSIEDVCSYLTSPLKGGIDDVFKRD